MYRTENKNMPENLAGLAKQAQNGETVAFGRIYEIFFHKIYKFIYYRVSHKETAEDLTEEVFIKIFDKISATKNPDSLEAWIYQIARNKVIDHYRSQKSSVNLEDVADLPDLENNIVDTLQLTQESQQIKKLLKELNKDEQKILSLKFFEDLDNPVIAALLNKSEAAVRVAQHRALSKLKKLSEKSEEFV